MHAMGTSAVSRANRGRILSELQRSGPLSRAEIARATGLSVATVSRAVALLLGTGLIETQETPEETGGRPRSLVQLTSTAFGTLVMDVADHYTQTAVISLSGRVIESTHHDVPADMSPEGRLQHTIEVLRAQTTAASRRTTLVGVGVSVPGPVQEDGTVTFAPALDWLEIPLGSILSPMLRMPVAVGNDANLIAMAEAHYGAMRGSRALIAIAVFDGIGSGLVFGGTLWNGSRGYSGQIGRMLLTTEHVGNIYMGFGGLESQLGTLAIQQRGREIGLDLPDDVWPAVFGPHAHPGVEPLAAAILEEFTMALVNVCALLDPDVVVFTGRTTPIADHILPELSRRLVSRVLHVPTIIAESTHAPGTLLGGHLIALAEAGPLEDLVIET